MTVSFLEIAAQTTPATVTALILKWLSDAGLPATSWAERSVPRQLIGAFSTSMADALNLVAAIAKGNLLDLSEGEWLTQLADNVYDVQRKVAVPARGPVNVTNNSGGALNITVGQLLVRSTQTGAVYRNTAAASIANGATAAVEFTAEVAGLVGNAAVNTVTDALTPIPGVTFNNPGASNVWLVQIGTREESDESLRIRCKARWPGRGGGKTLLAYEGMALEIEQVRQARVFPNAPGDGKAIIVIAGDTNPLDNSVVLNAEALILPRASLCADVDVQAASATNLSITATVYVEPAYLATSALAIDTALRALVSNRRIGQGIYRAEIVEALMSVPGAGNATLASPNTDVTVAETAILSLLSAPTITVAPLPSALYRVRRALAARVGFVGAVLCRVVAGAGARQRRDRRRRSLRRQGWMAAGRTGGRPALHRLGKAHASRAKRHRRDVSHGAAQGMGRVGVLRVQGGDPERDRSPLPDLEPVRHAVLGKPGGLRRGRHALVAVDSLRDNGRVVDSRHVGIGRPLGRSDSPMGRPRANRRSGRAERHRPHVGAR